MCPLQLETLTQNSRCSGYRPTSLFDMSCSISLLWTNYLMQHTLYEGHFAGNSTLIHGLISVSQINGLLQCLDGGIIWKPLVLSIPFILVKLCTYVDWLFLIQASTNFVVFLIGEVFHPVYLLVICLPNTIDNIDLSCLKCVHACVRSRTKWQVSCEVSSPQIEQISIYLMVHWWWLPSDLIPLSRFRIWQPQKERAIWHTGRECG